MLDHNNQSYIDNLVQQIQHLSIFCLFLPAALERESQRKLREKLLTGIGHVNRTQQEIPNAETMKQTESHAVKIVVEAARRLL